MSVEKLFEKNIDIKGRKIFSPKSGVTTTYLEKYEVSAKDLLDALEVLQEHQRDCAEAETNMKKMLERALETA